MGTNHAKTTATGITREFKPGLGHRFYFIRKGLYKSISKHAPALKGKLLDFGCGSKPYQSLFRTDEYIGLDYENTGHDHRNEMIDVFYDGKKIPFEDGHFDSVLCSEVAEHVFTLPDTLTEISRVMKKGGKMLLTCPFVWPEHEVPFDYARYTQFALNDLFEKNGFKVLVAEKAGSFVETIAQVRVLYFVQWAEPFLSKLSYPGSFVLKSIIFLKNLSGRIKHAVFPALGDFYLSNIYLVEKK